MQSVKLLKSRNFRLHNRSNFTPEAPLKVLRHRWIWQFKPLSMIYKLKEIKSDQTVIIKMRMIELTKAKQNVMKAQSNSDYQTLSHFTWDGIDLDKINLNLAILAFVLTSLVLSMYERAIIEVWKEKGRKWPGGDIKIVRVVQLIANPL